MGAPSPSKPSILLPLILLITSAGVVVATVLLSIWSHGSWNQAATASGVVATVVAAGVLLGSGQGWVNGTRLSFAAIATGVIGVAAVSLAVVTYIGGTSNAGLSASRVQASSADTPTDASGEGAALAGATSNNVVEPPGYSHDLGQHPTFDQFMSMSDAQVLANVPGGTLTPAEVPLLRDQLQQARAAALKYDTVEKARAGGYFNTTNDVPFMGAHFINGQYLLDGVFDASKPEGLLFSRLGNPNGDLHLVGVWYLILPNQAGSTATVPPQGFAGNLDLWHAHYGLCTRAGIISENNTQAGCLADQGHWLGDLRWMMHVWVYPESGVDNSGGVFSYLNQNLYDKQQADPRQPQGLTKNSIGDKIQ